MKNMKKILALVVAVLMIVASVSAFAADPINRDTTTAGATPLNTKTITLTNPTAGHTYTLYQVFVGTYKKINNEDTLGDIRWGSDVNSTYTSTNVAKTVADAIEDTAAGARAFANTIDAQLTGGTTKSTDSDKDASGNLVWNNLSEGYYIIKDTTTNLPEGHTADLVVVQVLNDVSIAAKSGTVEFDKKVADRNDSTQKPTVYDDYGNTSDYDIGDDVPFEITIKLPANFTSYEKYSATVHDKMDAGLSLNDSSIQVFVGNSATALTSGYELKKTELPTGETFEIVFADVKALSGVGDNVVITVKYTAQLIGDNVVYGNPGNKNEAWLTYSNNPTTGQEGGTTPHKTTVTFTYKLELDKTDGTNPLPGAEFTLEKQIKKTDDTTEWVPISVIKNDAGTVFTSKGLDDGNYRITETKTPAGYNSIDPIYFTIEATHGETLDALSATQKTGEFQAIDPKDATATFEATLTKVGDGKDAGLIDTDIVNNKGVNLPSTGGMGTTILYIGGSILVILAAVLLITKRRMNAND